MCPHHETINDPCSCVAIIHWTTNYSLDYMCIALYYGSTICCIRVVIGFAFSPLGHCGPRSRGAIPIAESEGGFLMKRWMFPAC